MEYEYRDILKQPLDKDELDKLAATGGIAVKDMLNPKSTGFKNLGLELEKIGDSEAAGLIGEHPKIMRRPLLTDGKTLVIGFDEDKYAKLV